jgi:hypothetical protein
LFHFALKYLDGDELSNLICAREMCSSIVYDLEHPIETVYPRLSLGLYIVTRLEFQLYQSGISLMARGMVEKLKDIH